MWVQLVRRTSESFRALLRPKRPPVDHKEDKASSKDFSRGAISRRYHALVLFLRRHPPYADALLTLVVILIAFCAPRLLPPHSQVDLLSFTTLYVFVQALPLIARRSRPVESLVLVAVIAIVFRLWGPISLLSIVQAYSWPGVFRPICSCGGSRNCHRSLQCRLQSWFERRSWVSWCDHSSISDGPHRFSRGTFF